MTGNHTIERCYKVTEQVLKKVFDCLKEKGVYLGGIILKPNMILAGSECPDQPNEQTIAELTVKCLQSTVPKEVPGIAFLSGGQSDKKATNHLNLMNQLQTDKPLNFSFITAGNCFSCFALFL